MSYRALLSRLLLFAISLAASFLVAEIGLRWFYPQNVEPHPKGMYVADPALGYRLAPDFSGTSRDPDWMMSVETNSAGLRDSSLETVGPIRILLIGDSFTFGVGVEAEATFSEVVERRLRDSGVSIVNAGTPGYGTRQQSELLSRLANQVEPSAVLLALFLGNDFLDNLQLNEYRIIGGYLTSVSQAYSNAQLTQRLGIPPEVKAWLRTNLHLYALLMNVYTKMLVERGAEMSEEILEIYSIAETPMAAASWLATADALSEIKRFCEDLGIPFGLIVIPDGRVEAIVASTPGHRLDRPNQLLEEWSRQNEVPRLDLSATFAGQSQLYFPVDPHWTVEGHELAGGRIAEALTGGSLRRVLDEAVSTAGR